MTSYVFYPDNRNQILFANLDIWEPGQNYILNGSPHNYLKRLTIKVKLLLKSIEHVQSCIDNPEYSKAAKELIFIPTLRRYQRSLKIYDK